jgi:5'-nucleotidase
MKILYFDMDNVLVDFQSAFKHLSEDTLKEYEGRLDEVPGLFGLMEPMDGALDAYRHLVKKYDSYILSTAPWENPSALTDKLHWVKKYLAELYELEMLGSSIGMFEGRMVGRKPRG